jgi:two-component system response regulator AtoC
MVGTSRGAILVVASDIDAQNYLETALRSQGFAVQVADNRDDVCKTIRGVNQVSLVLLDHVQLDQMFTPATARVGMIREIRSINRSLPIVVMTSGPDSGWDCNRYENLLTIPKPVFYDDLTQAISELVPGDPEPPQPLPPLRPYYEFPPDALNPRIRQISKLIDQAARSDVPVLIQGETGVGKEMLLREIHARSSRARFPFVNINCAALPKELVESQLFGHERGAFTGAHRSQPGLFEVAEGGTILLDEIGDMDIRLQAKLLQVLQDSEFHRLGGSTTLHVDVRVMAATHRDLLQAVACGRVRADLYYRLKVISIEIPPMRERREEIIPLAEFFLRKHASLDAAPPELNLAVQRRLLAYDWPGNVRELENVMRRYLVLRDPTTFPEVRPVVVPEVAPEVDRSSNADHSIFDSLDQTKRQAQVDALVAALNTSRWNRKKAAVLLRLDYKQLLYQMKKLRIEGANRRTRSRGHSRKPSKVTPFSGPLNPARQLS